MRFVLLLAAFVISPAFAQEALPEPTVTLTVGELRAIIDAQIAAFKATPAMAKVNAAFTSKPPASSSQKDLIPKSVESK